jgi:hypothetical protein
MTGFEWLNNGNFVAKQANFVILVMISPYLTSSSGASP